VPPVSLMFLPSALPKGARVLLVTGEFCATSCFSSTVDAWVTRELSRALAERGRIWGGLVLPGVGRTPVQVIFDSPQDGSHPIAHGVLAAINVHVDSEEFAREQTEMFRKDLRSSQEITLVNLGRLLELGDKRFFARFIESHL
jgi:hypothetical protein